MKLFFRRLFPRREWEQQTKLENLIMSAQAVLDELKGKFDADTVALKAHLESDAKTIADLKSKSDADDKTIADLTAKLAAVPVAEVIDTSGLQASAEALGAVAGV